MGTGRRLLLADDSITIQKVVNLTFADEGLDVTTVGNGDLAIEKIEEIAPDIVLADIHMPGLNGYEVCEFVKRDERFRHIPVMLLVGSFEPFNEAEARRVGADDYLTKPFQSIRQLVSKVGSLLSGKSADDETPTKELDKHSDVQSDVEAQTDSTMASATNVPPGSEFAGEATFASEGPQDHFADLALDDAMIETTPVGGHNMNATISGTQRSTKPMSPADKEEADVSRAASSAIHTQDTLRMVVERLSTNKTSEPAPAFVQAERSSRAFTADDTLLDLGYDEPLPVTGGAEDFVLDVWDDTPAAGSSPAIAIAETPSVKYQSDVKEMSAATSEHVAAEVMEPPPHVEATPVHEPESEIVSVDPVVDSSRAAASRTGIITSEQMSSEVIDAIARRAIEQLSEKVVEQIVWEVVPDLAERLIKHRLDEERKQ